MDFCEKLDEILNKTSANVEKLRENLAKTQETLTNSFNLLIEDLKTSFFAEISSINAHFLKELANLELLLAYFSEKSREIKENCVSPSNSREKTQELQSLADSLQKSSETLGFEPVFIEDFAVFRSFFLEKQQNFSKTCQNISPFSRILANLRDFLDKSADSLPSLSSPSSFSSKTAEKLLKKREIATKHGAKLYQEMFNPSNTSILKISHFRDNFYMTAGWDGRINVTNLLGKKTVLNIEAHKGPIREITQLQRNLYISTADDGLTKLWRLESNGESREISQFKGEKNNNLRSLLVFGGLFGKLLTGDDQGYVKIYALPAFSLEKLWKISQFAVTCLCNYQENREKTLVGTARGEIFVFCAREGRVLEEISQGHEDWITSMQWFPNTFKGNQVFCSSSYDCFVKVWKSEAGNVKSFKKIKCDAWVFKAIFFKEHIIVAASGNSIVVIEWEKEIILRKIANVKENYVFDLCLSRKDGAVLCVGQDDANFIDEYSSD